MHLQTNKNSRMLPCDRIGDLVNTSGTELRSQGHSDADLIKLIIRFSGRKEINKQKGDLLIKTSV